MDQVKLRNMLNKYIEENGIAAKFIANRCDIPDYTLSKFRNGKIELYEESADTLDTFLVEHHA